MNISSIKQRILGILSFSEERSQSEFLPAALEIVETPASPAARAVAGTIILFFAIAFLWACFGSVDVIAIAQGRIMPSSRIKTIQPFETGVVRSIHVQDGQKVKAGDILIEIDPTINGAERDRLEADLMQARLEAARLSAAVTLDAEKFVPPIGTTEQDVSLQRRLLASQINEIKAKVTGLDRQIAQSQANKKAVEATIEKLKGSIPILQKQYDMRVKLAKMEWGNKMSVLLTEQDLLEHKKELQVQEGRLTEASEGIGALQEQRQQAVAEFHHKTLDDLTTAEQKVANLQKQLVQAAQKLKLQTLTAPVDGTVQQLAVHTEGGVVTPAQALLTIVPTENELEIEANVSNRDIGFVFPGQEAAIKIDTFNFTKYGFLSGKIESVSQDAISRAAPLDSDSKTKQTGAESESSEPKGQELVYIARIKLDQSQMQIDDRLVDLSPGMAVTAEIKTGHRRIIEYLLSPLARHTHQAMRER
jgi:hemolysin D